MEKARQIGTLVVEKQLAACVNLLPGVESVYRWEGKVEVGREVLGIFKTTREALRELERVLLEEHPYEVPEVVALKVEEVAERYGKWVRDEVG